MKTIFFGTAPLACPSLEAVVGSTAHRVIGVVTQPDRPAGRKLRLQPSAIKALAIEHGLPVLQPERARDPFFIDQIRALAPDLAIVVAYGQILPQALLELAPLGFLNVHASLLPRYRGAAPIQWAIWNGEPETGVTIMKLDEGLDTGLVLSQGATPICDSDNAQSLHDRLAHLGAQLLMASLPSYVAGRLVPQPQSHSEVSYARKITRDDARLDWSLPARRLWNQTRALVPWPGTFTHLPGKPEPLLLKVWESDWIPTGTQQVSGSILESSAAGILVACGQDALRLRVIQPEGRRRMTAAEFVAGHTLHAGETLATISESGSFGAPTLHPGS